MNAHIYKARQGKFTLLVTTGASIYEGVVFQKLFDSKAEAKAEAKKMCAKPYNY